jgi:amino acid adenylation domain-containing protein
MSVDAIEVSRLRQDAIRAKCVHPRGRWTEFPREALDESVVTRLEWIVDRHSQRLAVKHDDEELTYAEFDRRANRLAQTLLAKRGPQAEPVALLLSQGCGALVAMLAVLKAGKFYVMLDQEQPAARLSATLVDAGAEVLICERDLLSRHPELTAQISCVIDAEEISPLSADRPRLSLGPQTRAFITYTSGSTAQPKGVLYNHANIVHQAFELTNLAHICPEDRISLARPYGYNGAVKDIYGALLSGASVFPLNPRKEGLTHIAERLCAERITIWCSVTSTFRALCQALTEAEALPDLRFVLFGGETIQAHDIELFQRHFARDAVLLLNYGITETAGTVCRWLVDRATRVTDSTVPAGFPIDDMIVRILDDAGNAVPTGTAGEIVVTSRHLTQGYWGLPELTRQAFVVDPLDPNWRTYRTGDLGLLDASGCLTHLGRKDSRVKIRGRFVDPGEVERALQTLASVREAAVVPRPDARGETSLTAYVVSRVHPAPTTSAMRSELARTLPDYMLPSSFIVLDSLPLTSGGKIDRQALPAADGTRPALDGEFEAARTPLEQCLVDLWQDVLNVDAIGIHDDFFELGGDSLQAMRLVGRLQADLREPMYVVAVFNHPTVSELGAHLETSYARAVRRLTGDVSSVKFPIPVDSAPATRLTFEHIRQVRSEQLNVHTACPSRATDVSTGPRAIFILSSPRCGSTLLRVMLAGHPALFAPPELHLLMFDTLGDRRRVLSRGQSARREGAIQAVMSARGCSFEQAVAVMSELESQGLSTGQFYQLLQSWISPRVLVDKTPIYALDIRTLKCVERLFDQPMYVHLARHPLGMIRSYLDARMEEMALISRPDSLTPPQFAESLWLISQQNITEHLRGIPPERQLLVRFEDLVQQPQPNAERICSFLGIPMHAALLHPYDDGERRMTNPIHSQTRMAGDPKFHTHRGISASAADRWRQATPAADLCDATLELAQALGYRCTSHVEVSRVA